jgi:uncharacterized protein (DUF983 family)
MSTDATVIVAPDGRPARRVKSDHCPGCGEGPDKRVGSGGFGRVHPVCGGCGFEFVDEVWHGRTER